MITGGCLCGAVRYEIDARPLGGGLCHCRDCQYRSGGGPSATIALPRAAFRLTRGALRESRTLADSGILVGRSFCEACGTGISAFNPRVADLIPISAGSLDDPDRFSPHAHVWLRSAPAWHAVDRTLPCFEADAG
ncbi:GFA family protein [Phenylobacterium sp.]|uniref:GFA family protein n=1 Tax=Phenylobacterium sp. TaxID=1871053 RepID=UPI00351E3E06